MIFFDLTGKMCFIVLLSLLLACKAKVTNDSKEQSDPKENDQHRPQFHFTPDSMWMNDPNGMVFYNGEYHLFYQYYPDSIVWGPMHWGHAVSPDLVRWHQLPVALYPDSLGYIFSGSVVIDKGNTSGLGKNGKDPMIAIFTHHNPELEKKGRTDFQYQSIAFSNDNGRTFTKYTGNPVIKNPGVRDFRDPKVFWHKPTNKWIMVLAVYDKVFFYASPNLISWSKTGSFGIPGDKRLWECPDLFPMNVEGSKEEKWVLITSIQQQAPNGGTATSYFIGNFDGNTFIGDPLNQKWLDYGTDNYAMVTWSNITDGRTLALGWMSNWQYAQQVPTVKWRSAMTLPRELRLVKEGDNYFLSTLPVRELALLEDAPQNVNDMNSNDDVVLYENIQIAKLNLSFLKKGTGTTFVRFSNDLGQYLDVGFDAVKNNYFVDRTHAGKASFNPDFAKKHFGQSQGIQDSVKMMMYIDHASVELFADEGLCTMTDIFFPDAPLNKATLIREEKRTPFKATFSKIKSARNE